MLLYINGILMKFVVRIQYYLFKLSKFANKIYRYKNQLNSVLVRLGNRLTIPQQLLGRICFQGLDFFGMLELGNKETGGKKQFGAKLEAGG